MLAPLKDIRVILDHVVWVMQGGKVVGGTVRGVVAPSVYCAMADAGYDFIWTEMQHEGSSWAEAWRAWATCPHAKAVPGVRVAYTDEREIQHALDGGALVLVVPTVDTVEEAREAVNWAYFPPLGRRSLGGGNAFGPAMWGNVPGGYRNTINDNLVLILMIETLEGLKNADEIAKVPGVTAIFAASSDISNFSGFKQGDPDHPYYMAAQWGTGEAPTDVAADDVTPEQAVAHPNWVMGRKISVDSATMMNKGLEVIEAHWLFNAPREKIEVVVHPESIVHSMVEYVDGSVIAQLGNPDMRTPIAHALAYPERITNGVTALDLAAAGSLHFEKPDWARFPCLALAFDALRAGEGAATVLNAANEVAVAAFLEERIGYLQIAALLEDVLSKADCSELRELDDVFEADRNGRAAANAWIARHASLTVKRMSA